MQESHVAAAVAQRGAKLALRPRPKAIKAAADKRGDCDERLPPENPVWCFASRWSPTSVTRFISPLAASRCISPRSAAVAADDGWLWRVVDEAITRRNAKEVCLFICEGKRGAPRGNGRRDDGQRLCDRRGVADAKGRADNAMRPVEQGRVRVCPQDPRVGDPRVGFCKVSAFWPTL